MKDHVLFGELFLKSGTLLSIVYILSSLYVILYCYLHKMRLKSNRTVLLSYVVGLISIVILICAKHLMPTATEYVNLYGFKSVSLSNFIILFLPIQIYFIQKRGYIKPSLSNIIGVYSLFLFLNLVVLSLFANNIVNHIPIILYPISVIIVGVISFQAYSIYSYVTTNGLKMVITNGEVEEIFTLFASILLSILIFLTIVLKWHPANREGLKLILALINFVFLIIIYVKANNNTPLSLCQIDGNRSRMIESIDGGSFDQNKSNEIKERLVEYFITEKPYLEPKINILQVSLYLYTNKTYVSRVINEHFNCNFSQFVNSYRVKEAVSLFKEDTSLSIQQMCDMSGFGSMATFSIAFRYFSGQSPADWCKNYKIGVTKHSYR